MKSQTTCLHFENPVREANAITHIVRVGHEDELRASGLGLSIGVAMHS